jgi:proton glutamate symport protein
MWVMVAAVAGILAGIVFGERTSALIPVGSAYAMMLQVAIYPYLLCSLLEGLGRLTPALSRKLFGATWPAYLFVWVLTFGVIWLLGHAIPLPPAPTSLVPVAPQEKSDLLSVLIPANIFDALSRNYVPAVVLFALAYGVGIQSVERKQTFLEILAAIRVASVKIWGWTVKFAPIGVFALFAGTAGTVQAGQISGLLVYIGLFVVGSAIIGFIILPAVLAIVAPVSYREILAELQPGLVLTLATTLPVVSVPYVERLAQRISERTGCPQTEETASVIKTTLSLGYVLAQLGNYFVYLFIFYAAYTSTTFLSLAQQLLLPLLTLLSCFGTPSSTIDSIIFISKWLHLPDSVLNIYIETWTLTRYPQILLSVMGFGFVTCVIPLIYFGKTSFRRVMSFCAVGVISILLIGVTIAVGIGFRANLFPQRAETVLTYTLAPGLTRNLDVTVYSAASKSPVATQTASSLAAIRASDSLRVGYNPNVIPFCYLNNHGELVGLDVSYVYQLARDLNVKLELIPYEWQDLSQDLQTGRFDLAIAGIYVTTERLGSLEVSDAYFESPIALIVRSEQATRFVNGASVIAMPHLKLAAFGGPALISLVHQLFPRAAVEFVPNYNNLSELGEKIDAAVWTLEQASAWATAHPGFTAVQPSDLGAPIPFAFLLPPGAQDFREYLNQWLKLKTTAGFRQTQIDYWIDGKPRTAPKPRWNLCDALTGSRAE